MASIIKREESQETFLRTILRTSTLPPAELADDASTSSATSTYKEEDVEPAIWLPNTILALQHGSSRASSVSMNSVYQGSSPRKYSMHGHSSRDLFFPAYAAMNAARQDQNTDQMVSQDTFGSQQELQFPFPSFVTEDAQQAEQFMEQPPKLQLQLDGSWRQRSNSEGIHDLVAFSRGNAEALGTLTARLDKIEMDNRALRETVAQLVNDATAGSRSAPGPTTRYRDVTTSRLSSPITPTKVRYEPFQTFQLSSPVPQDEESFISKLTPSKKSKKGEKTRDRKALKVKIPNGKKNVVPSVMTTPSKKIDSGYLTGNMASGFPNLMTPTSGQLTGTMGSMYLTTPASTYPRSPVTPGRIGPPSTQKRGVTSVNKRKNHSLKESMPPSRAMVPNVPLTDTEVIVYFFQSLARPQVALRLYSRHWGPAGIVEILNTHRDIQGGYLRNTCSVKCITAINRGKDKYGDDWEESFRSRIEEADDITATDMMQHKNDELEGVVDYDIRDMGKGLLKHPKEGEDGGIFTRCVKYCIEHDAGYTLANVHLLALALQGGIDPQKLVIDGGEEFVVEDEEGIEEDV
ncbi:hypothetical protein AA0117_g8471 [Alternaria alternata]|uniref:Uncharacterized protein n=1 Tax=Alternaria alternata TaxID=5599 RepID=A0A4Q4N9D2_ALTAL|nr:hypothetical protein AA0118_g10378 [Alternaria tenuissima]RYN72496.1 hypothetical protein AA0117_g8471 [Alternaria alternata]